MATAPVLPATTLADACYSGMFLGCSALTSITVHFTEWSPANATMAWVGSVSGTGTFYHTGLTDLTQDANHIPSGWTPALLP